MVHLRLNRRAASDQKTTDPRDYFRQLQLQLDTLRPAIQQAESLQRQMDASLSSPIREMLRQFEANRHSFNAADEIVAPHRALFAAIQPIQVESALAQFASISESWSRVNKSIADASFLGEILLGHEGSEDTAVESETPSSVERQLVEIVSADVLSDLKRVEFAPLTLLDSALRSPEMMRLMKAREFEGFIAALIDQLGFEDVILTPRSGDEGRDVLATKSVHGIQIMFAFECKRYAKDHPVGPNIARALLGTISHGSTRASKGVLVTTSQFTPSARRFILTEPDLDGKDFDGIVGWLKEYGSRNRSN